MLLRALLFLPCLSVFRKQILYTVSTLPPIPLDSNLAQLFRNDFVNVLVIIIIIIMNFIPNGERVTQKAKPVGVFP